MKVLEIKEEDLKYNLNQIKNLVKENNQNPKLYAVLKGNGMGLDLVKYANFLLKNDISSFAVANFEEAIKLRDNGINNEILMLTPTSNKVELTELINKDVILSIGSIDEIKLIEDISKLLNKKVKAHIKIDTGFGRYGFLYNNFNEILSIFDYIKNIEIEGIFTHFPTALNRNKTIEEFNRFKLVIEKLEEKGHNIKVKHVCASTSFLLYPEMWLDAVRLGSVIQGRVLVKKDKFRKVGTFKTEIAEIKILPKGFDVSYGSTFKTKKDTKVAIIPVGYTDGFNRLKSRDDFSLKNNLISVGMEIKKIFKDNSLKVTINEKNYKVIGRLGMYYAVIDINDSDNISVGDTVIINISPLQANSEIRREYI